MDRSIEDADETKTEESAEEVDLFTGPKDAISFDGVTVGAPEQTGYRLLVKNVSLVVGPGEHLLITGPNGAGKTSLLVLAGLWEPVEGHVSTPKAENYDGGKVMMWLPQRPYLLRGSLRDWVVYPNIALAGGGRGTKRVDANAVADEDERVKQCLRAAGLGKFVDGGVPGVSLTPGTSSGATSCPAARGSASDSRGCSITRRPLPYWTRLPAPSTPSRRDSCTSG